MSYDQSSNSSGMFGKLLGSKFLNKDFGSPAVSEKQKLFEIGSKLETSPSQSNHHYGSNNPKILVPIGQELVSHVSHG